MVKKSELVEMLWDYGYKRKELEKMSRTDLQKLAKRKNLLVIEESPEERMVKSLETAAYPVYSEAKKYLRKHLREKLITTKSLRIMTISDLLYNFCVKIPTKPGSVLELVPTARHYFWIPVDYGYPGKPIQVLSWNLGTGLSGIGFVSPGRFLWKDHPFPAIKKLVREIAEISNYADRVEDNKNIDGTCGLGNSHGFPLLFYITKKISALENVVFTDKISFPNGVISWTVAEKKPSGLCVVGKAVAVTRSKNFSKIKVRDLGHPIGHGVLLMGDNERALSFGLEPPNNINIEEIHPFVFETRNHKLVERIKRYKIPKEFDEHVIDEDIWDDRSGIFEAS